VARRAKASSKTLSNRVKVQHIFIIGSLEKIESRISGWERIWQQDDVHPELSPWVKLRANRQEHGKRHRYLHNGLEAR
jgi:hypothetical protein